MQAVAGSSDFYRRASALYDLGRVREAIGELQAALSQDPNDPASHALLAMCLGRTKDYAGALAEAERAIGLDPEMGYAFYARAWILLCQGKLDDARNAIVEALRLEPRRASHWACRAEIEYRDDHHHTSLESSAQGLAIDPQDVDCLIWRAQALRSLSRPGEALAAAQQAIVIDPDSSDAHAAVGWVHLSQLRRAQALPFFREATRLDPQSRWARSGHREALSGGWANSAVWLGLLVCFVGLSLGALAGVFRVSPHAEAGSLSTGFLVLAFVRLFMSEEFLFGHAEGRRYLALAEPAEYWTWSAFCVWLGCGPLLLWNDYTTLPWITGLALLPTVVGLCVSRQWWLSAGLAVAALVQVALAALFTAAWLESWPKESALGIALALALPAFCWAVLHHQARTAK